MTLAVIVVLVALVFLAFIAIQSVVFWLFFDRVLGENEIVVTVANKGDRDG